MTADLSLKEGSLANDPAFAILQLPDMVLESASDPFLLLLKKTPAEVLGKKAQDVFTAAGFNKLATLLKTGNSTKIIDETTQPVEFFVHTLITGEGIGDKIAVFAYRILAEPNESVKTEMLPSSSEGLKRQVKDLRAITVATADVVYRMNADWSRVLEMNSPHFLAPVLGQEQGWLEQYILPQEQARVLAAIKEAIDKKQLFELEHRVVLPNGEEGWTLSRAIPVADELGNIIEWLGMAMDITRKKQAEQELLTTIEEAEQERRMYETITSNTPDLVYVFDLDARFTYANQALLTMWGRTKEESFGKSLLEIGYEPWHAAMHEREIEHIKKTHETVRGEVAFPHATLGKRVYDYILVPVLDAQGQVSAIAGTTRDITEIKKLSAQKDEFLAIASHELKTPLTSVKAYGQVLQEIFQRKDDTVAVNLLQRMDNQVNKLTGLVNDLLDVTRIQSGKIQFNEELFDLAALTGEILDNMQLTTQKHVIRKHLPPVAMLHGDRERIGQVVTNLVNNAIKYSPAGGEVQVMLRDENDHYLLSVKDFGIGIPENMQSKVFEQFYRANNHKHSIAGMGIGLFITSEIVKRSSGTIWVESVEGSGSTFFVSLPKK